MSIIAPLTLVERAAATQATKGKFAGKPLSFKDGCDCLHMIREHMQAFGYSPPAIPGYTTATGAMRALRKQGHADLAGLIDTLLPRIAPAKMLVGDIALLSGTPPFDSLVVNAGGKVLGWSGEGQEGLVNIIVHGPYIAAWRLV